TPASSNTASKATPSALQPQAAAPLPRAVRNVLHRRDIRNRFIAGIAFFDLAALWWWLSYRSPQAATVAEGRPFLRLGEDPSLLPQRPAPTPLATNAPALR